MGFGVTELLIILAIVLVLFGAKKLRNIGGDLGGAIKNFKTAMKDEEDKNPSDNNENSVKLNDVQLNKKEHNIIEGTVDNKVMENKIKETM
jgi:sec-independent protein translocase protein TatA